MEIPTVEYGEESETYTIKVGDISIYIKYGADKEFQWTNKQENSIHIGKIEIKEES